MDITTVAEQSAYMEHLSDLFAFRGRPANRDETNPLTLFVNHGYMIGYSPKYMQPAWAAYRVSAAAKDVDYERPHLFYEDRRLPQEWQIGTRGFGKVDGRRYDRGHLVPNYAINTQFGRLAQMETFFMSNICPQEANMNRGIWQRLEKKILREYAAWWQHIWVMTGPIFPKTPKYIQRSKGKKIAIPSSFFAILVDPVKWPHDQPKNVNFLALDIPQNAGYEDVTNKHVTTVKEIERATGLNFFPSLTTSERKTMENRTSTQLWERQVPLQ